MRALGYSFFHVSRLLSILIQSILQPLTGQVAERTAHIMSMNRGIPCAASGRSANARPLCVLEKLLHGPLVLDINQSRVTIFELAMAEEWKYFR